MSWQTPCMIGIITICILAISLSTKTVLLQSFPSLQPTPNSQRVHSSKSSTSGLLFKGNVVRKFPPHLARFTSLTQNELQRTTNYKESIFNNYTKPKACRNWVVVTTIFLPSDSVRKVAELDGWCLVVVADKKSSLSYDLDNIIYLTVQDQQELTRHYNFIGQIPWNHFGRKNVGYFYAMLHNAEYIFDLDDDNVLKQKDLSLPKSVMRILATNCSAFNIYLYMNASTYPSWPRGFPLGNIKQKCTCSLERRDVNREETVIFQSLADEDPDVDAIYRMTLPLPFYFKADIGLEIPPGVLVPYNAQASLHFRKSLWGTLLPVTVHGRVSDIWRSYFTQRIVWEIGGRIAFIPSLVNQFRNPHNYIQDFDAEMDLYLKTDALIKFLLSWKPQTTTLPGLIEELWIAVYERDYINKEDVELVQTWLDALIRIGYDFSVIKPYSSSAKTK